MSRVTVKNPTTKTKAVRTKGGFESIKPGGKATVDADWDELTRDRYLAAGLLMSDPRGRKPKGEDDPDQAEG